jgi:hypothetical protein
MPEPPIGPGRPYPKPPEPEPAVIRPTKKRKPTPPPKGDKGPKQPPALSDVSDDMIEEYIRGQNPRPKP